jgi:hypothetical protein
MTEEGNDQFPSLLFSIEEQEFTIGDVALSFGDTEPSNLKPFLFDQFTFQFIEEVCPFSIFLHLIRFQQFIFDLSKNIN